MTDKKTAGKKEKSGTTCRCPYCETEVMVVKHPFCNTCGLELRRCVSCLVVLPKDAKTCPECGKNNPLQEMGLI